MILADEAATLELGARLAAVLKQGDAIALSGVLGAGKTTLARGVLKALGLKGEAPSPTFALVQPYAPPETRIPVWHVDLYRIEDSSEIDELGLAEARREVAMLIEWPERPGEALWDDALGLEFAALERPGARRLTARVPPAWETRWPPA